MDRGTWQDTIYGVTKESDTIEQLNTTKFYLNLLLLTKII